MDEFTAAVVSIVISVAVFLVMAVLFWKEMTSFVLEVCRCMIRCVRRNDDVTTAGGSCRDSARVETGTGEPSTLLVPGEAPTPICSPLQGTKEDPAQPQLFATRSTAQDVEEVPAPMDLRTFPSAEIGGRIGAAVSEAHGNGRKLQTTARIEKAPTGAAGLCVLVPSRPAGRAESLPTAPPVEETATTSSVTGAIPKNSKSRLPPAQPGDAGRCNKRNSAEGGQGLVLKARSVLIDVSPTEALEFANARKRHLSNLTTRTVRAKNGANELPSHREGSSVKVDEGLLYGGRVYSRTDVPGVFRTSNFKSYKKASKTRPQFRIENGAPPAQQLKDLSPEKIEALRKKRVRHQATRLGRVDEEHHFRVTCGSLGSSKSGGREDKRI